jgi:serine/threonine-protein kinase RsbW
MTGWRMRQIPGTDEEIARWEVVRPPQLAGVRAALRRVLHDRVAGSAVVANDLVERLVIVATELASNALRHARPPAVVALLRADSHLIVDVIDNEAGAPPVVDMQRPPGEGGLGLPLAAHLAEDVGWYLAGSSKHVWAQFSVPAI